MSEVARAHVGYLATADDGPKDRSYIHFHLSYFLKNFPFIW
jgi:hypothetical protein